MNRDRLSDLIRSGVVSLPADAPDKPYKAKRGSAWVTQVRAGTTTRDATDEEEVRLYQQSGRLQYDRKPVPGSSLADLDRRRLVNYFRDLRQQDCPPPEDEEAWTRLLVNTEVMIESRGRAMASAAGLLLFGAQPNRYLPQAGVSAAAYAEREKDYDAKERSTVRGPAVSLAFSERKPTERAIPSRREASPRAASSPREASSSGPSTSCAATRAWKRGSTSADAGRSAESTRWRQCGRRS